MYGYDEELEDWDVKVSTDDDDKSENEYVIAGWSAQVNAVVNVAKFIVHPDPTKQVTVEAIYEEVPKELYYE